MFRAWFSTVRSEMKRRFAMSFLLAPQANNSAISDSRLVSFTVSILFPPHVFDAVLGEYLFHVVRFKHVRDDIAFQPLQERRAGCNVECFHQFTAACRDVRLAQLQPTFVKRKLFFAHVLLVLRNSPNLGYSMFMKYFFNLPILRYLGFNVSI